jgi:hypothetical protein
MKKVPRKRAAVDQNSADNFVSSSTVLCKLIRFAVTWIITTGNRNENVCPFLDLSISQASVVMKLGSTKQYVLEKN